MSYQQLFFNAADLSTSPARITLHLHCPVCGYQFTAYYSFGASFPATYDYNQLTSFTIPSHASLKTGGPCIFPYNKISLYVAAHKDTNGIALCTQRSNAEGATGIPALWWQRSP
jgi:hypothetical protein